MKTVILVTASNIKKIEVSEELKTWGEIKNLSEVRALGNNNLFMDLDKKAGLVNDSYVFGEGNIKIGVTNQTKQAFGYDVEIDSDDIIDFASKVRTLRRRLVELSEVMQQMVTAQNEISKSLNEVILNSDMEDEVRVIEPIISTNTQPRVETVDPEIEEAKRLAREAGIR